MIPKSAGVTFAALCLILIATNVMQPAIPSAMAQATDDFLTELKTNQEANPQDPDTAGRLGMYFHAHEMHRQALHWYAIAHSLAGKDWRWRYLSGLALSEMARAQEAVVPLRAAYTLAPEQEAVAVNLARILSTLGLLTEALQVLETARGYHPTSAPLLAELGLLMLASSDAAKAINYLQSALQADPAASRLYYPLASALRASGDAPAAQRAVSRAGSVAPRLNDPAADAMRSLSQSYSFYMSQGLLAASSGDWPAARALLERAVAENPADPTVGVNLARVLESMGDLNTAERELQRVLAENPEHAPGWFNLGVLAELAQDDALALERYTQALARDPEDFRSHLLAAAAALRLDRHHISASHYSAAARLKPERDELLVRQAVSQWRGDCAAAVETALSLVQRRPEDPAALVLYVRLVATCAAAPRQARVNALNAARNLALLNPSPDMQINQAMAEAASGNFDAAAALQRQANDALSADLTHDQSVALGQLLYRYQSRLPADQPFILNEQVLNPPRLTPADRR